MKKKLEIELEGSPEALLRASVMIPTLLGREAAKFAEAAQGRAEMVSEATVEAWHQNAECLGSARVTEVRNDDVQVG